MAGGWAEEGRRVPGARGARGARGRAAVGERVDPRRPEGRPHARHRARPETKRRGVFRAPRDRGTRAREMRVRVSEGVCEHAGVC